MESILRKSLLGYNVRDVDYEINCLKDKIHELTLKNMSDQQEIRKLKFAVDDLTDMLNVQKEILIQRREFCDK